MKIINYDELEDYLETYDYSEIECEYLNIDECSIIEVCCPEIEIVEYDLIVREGTMLTKYDDDEFYPDWSLTLLYEKGKTISDYLYLEQGSIGCSLHNYFTIIGEPVDIYELKFEVKEKIK